MARRHLKIDFNKLPPHEEMTAFLDAARSGDNAAVARFARRNPAALDAEIIHHSYVGFLALREAAAAGHIDTVGLLLSYGADVNAQDTMGGT